MGRLLEDADYGLPSDFYIDQVLKKLKEQGVKKSQFTISEQEQLAERFVDSLKKERGKRVKKIYNETYKYERTQLNQLAKTEKYSLKQQKI